MTISQMRTSMFTGPLARGLRALLRIVAQPASAHCDSEDGPVVKAGRRALISGDVDHALAWVQAGDEDEVRAAFTAVLDGLGPERVDADRRFLETLVRLHRAGEGAPFDGIKPSGTPQPPAVTAADRALETGSSVALERLVAADRWPGVQRRFDAALALKDHEVHDATAARAAVAAYVEFVHHAAAQAAGVENGAEHPHDQHPHDQHPHDQHVHGPRPHAHTH